MTENEKKHFVNYLLQKKHFVNYLLQNTTLLGFWLLSNLFKEESAPPEKQEVRKRKITKPLPIKRAAPPKIVKKPPPAIIKEEKRPRKEITDRNIFPKDGLKPKLVDMFLIYTGDAKIAIARAIRAETELGLKEIMGRIDSAPEVPIFQNIKFSEAERLMKLLNNAGAAVALKASE